MSWIQSAFGTKISPIILFVIVVLAVVFFIAALVHLLIRFLLKHSRSTNPNSFPDFSASRTFQRQLQHLFLLHDSGLDQALIDTLPVFLYKDLIMGSNFEPFDCAVCLCEFCEDDNLRLLPLCSHAFHIDCIDTWLLSNSSCPLCRGVIDNPCFYFNENEYGISRNDEESSVINEKRVFSVRLGKFKNTIDVSNSESGVGAVGESSNSNLDARRCYSMGSFQYVVADSELQVAWCHSGRDKVLLGKGRGGQNGAFTCDVDEGKKIKVGESFSVSKIWLWSKKSKLHTSTSSRGIQFSTNSVNESYN